MPVSCVPDIEKDVVQTPRNNRVLVRQFGARHFVYCIEGRHKEKPRKLTKSRSDTCPGDGGGGGGVGSKSGYAYAH